MSRLSETPNTVLHKTICDFSMCVLQTNCKCAIGNTTTPYNNNKLLTDYMANFPLCSIK